MKIPELRKQDGFKDVKIIECDEPLVNMKNIHPKIHIQSMYYEWNIPTALESIHVRQDVANKLIAVAENLPEHIHLLLWDGWRPVTVQQALFDDYVRTLSNKHPSLSIERLQYMALDFVSLPSKNPLCPSTHATGGAIDLTLCDRNSKPLNLGTAFDDFTDKANTRYLEIENIKEKSFADKEAQNLRRILFHEMTKVGFTNFHNEWWHYDYGNQWWAIIKGEEAKYGYIELHELIESV
jgi:D-alanyl-D-alanine dipeptidase